MTFDDAQKAADALADAMAEKGFPDASAKVDFYSHSAHDVWLHWEGSGNCELFSRHDEGDVLERAFAWISRQPDTKTRERQEFQADLGRLIDKGRGIGIEVEFLNPLTALAKELAENAITDQRETA